MLQLLRRISGGPRADDLLPIVIPTSIVEHPAWFGPSRRWDEVLSITWGHFLEPHVTTYVTRKEDEAFAARRRAYRQIALDNLRERSKGRVWSHIKRVGDSVQFLGLLHEDGLGPSRLLLRAELLSIFPKGFRFCVPERTCAIVFAKNADEASSAVVRDAIEGCFKKGREAVSDRVFDDDAIQTG